MTELKKGKRVFMLSPEEQEQLKVILNRENWSVEQAALKAKISYKKFYHPMSGKGGCSRETFKAMKRFIDKYSIIPVLKDGGADEINNTQTPNKQGVELTHPNLKGIQSDV